MVDKKALKQFIGRFFMIFVFGASIITVSVLADQFGPARYTYSDDDWASIDPITPPNYDSTKYNVILDQHSHTTYSDGVLSVKQNIEWHKAQGYNVIIFTDHDTLANKNDIETLRQEYLDEGILLIQGMEWTTYRIHMNILGLSEWPDPTPKNPTDAQIQETIEKAHAQNALVTVNHIPWSLNDANMKNHPTLDQLLEWGVDYIEIVNGNDYDLNSIEWYNDLSATEKQRIGFITGTDMHSPGAVYGWTFLKVTEFTVDAVMNELRARRTTISYSSIGYKDKGTYEQNLAYTIMSPLMNFGGIFSDLWDNGLDWLGVSVCLGYFFGIYAIIEVYIFIKPRFWKKIHK